MTVMRIQVGDGDRRLDILELADRRGMPLWKTQSVWCLRQHITHILPPAAF